MAITKVVTARFSEEMYPATINSETFTLYKGVAELAGEVGFDVVSNTAHFVPDEPLELGVSYTATIEFSVRNTEGRTMAADYIWSFTTGACSLGPVPLLSAGDFAVLGGATVTNTGDSVVIGDVGVAPGSAVTGFPPGSILGEIHAGDATSLQALEDLTLAYNDVAGRTLCMNTVSGNLGGQTLGPGLYKSTSSLAVSSGDLTLDAQGDSDAIFVFQSASTLTTTPGRQVILAGGAKSANIFWQVGTSATFGTTSVLHGTFLADQSISLGTGASLSGRALARVGAVTMESNVILLPLP